MLLFYILYWTEIYAFSKKEKKSSHLNYMMYYAIFVFIFLFLLEKENYIMQGEKIAAYSLSLFNSYF